ncbi:MAG: glutamyl-tRNA reductase [Deltaproteobacteria bacterium]|nr:glutamyl-tRNA reductase [Deltaproteobacteria bacterium]
MQADQLMIVGVNHKVAPVEIREKLAHKGSCEEPVVAIQQLPGCQECCFLGTCNRVEVICATDGSAEFARVVRQFLFSRSALSDEDAQKYSYTYVGNEAILHLFSVAASLDSMIVGEPQILGQLKKAYRNAVENKTVGAILNRLVNKSFSVAKRVRTETNIGGNAVSISFAAVQLAKKIFGNLEHKRVMILGAGEMAELAAEHLLKQGIAEVVVANRTLAKAVDLAHRFNGRAVSLKEFVPQLENIDILISSTGATELILLKEQVKPIMRQRMNSPLFLIDIAVPRDLDPDLNDIDNVYLYDIDNLTDVVEVNKSERQKEADSASRIVEEETINFGHWLEGLAVKPTIVALREKVEAVKQAELDKTLANLADLSPKQIHAVEVMAASICNKIIHNPTIYLKSGTRQNAQQDRINLVREMFDLS